MSPPKAYGEAKAMAAKPCYSNPATAAQRGPLCIFLSVNDPPAPRIRHYYLLHYPLPFDCLIDILLIEVDCCVI